MNVIINAQCFPRLLLATLILLAFNPAVLLAQDSPQGSTCIGSFSVAKFTDEVVAAGEGKMDKARSVVTIQVVGFTLSDAGVTNEYQEAPIELTVQEDVQASPSDTATKDDADSQADEPEENALLKSFPVANLRGGILPDSIQQAVAVGEIEASAISVEHDTVMAPEVYRFDQPGVWKTWQSPNICYRPLYFEEANVERYGIHCRLQPAVSGLHFLTNVFAWPYKRGFHDHHKCVYGLGYYPAGDCNPAYWSRLERAKGGFAAEVLTVGAIITLL